MRIMGIDYGKKRIGIAVSDALGMMAHPLETLHRTALADDALHIGELARSREVTKIIIGLPLNMDGTEGELALAARKFAAEIETRLHIPVELYDERLTTLQAERMLTEEADMSRDKRKQVRDKIAASYILQSYMDRHPNG
jgi:putative Holliday junction resolvase